jgi:hypothetical protein
MEVENDGSLLDERVIDALVIYWRGFRASVSIIMPKDVGAVDGRDFPRVSETGTGILKKIDVVCFGDSCRVAR